MSLPDLPPRQIAYFVEDAKAAAIRHHRMFGSGPYYLSEHIPLATSLHRGVQRPLDHTSAYGQWGEVMIEFVQQNNPGPSAFHDMYPERSDQFGLHHVALFVDSIEQEIGRFEAEGYAIALDAAMNDGFRFAFVDTSSSLGHMLELYEPQDVLTQFYGMVAQSAGDFSKGEIINISMA